MRSFALIACLASTLAPAAAATCESLSELKLPDTTISVARTLPAGSYTPPDGKPLPPHPAMCEVAGYMKPTADSRILFEIWMPSSEWNGKFQGVGNGGFAGVINYGGMNDAVNAGYATASTDTGHQGTGAEAGWAAGHPEKIVDFGYRAIHQTAVTAKAAINAFYGHGPQHSYFNSCSNGGRQALMEAQRFPEDYDGIIAGAPANYWTHLMANAVWDMQATLKDPATYIPASKLPAIEAALLAACDARDGVADGVIDDPTRCHFDPSRLVCKGAESDRCLTMPQSIALKKIYGGLRSSKGELLFPGYSPGGQTGSGGWGPWIMGTAPRKSLMFFFGTEFYRNMVFNDQLWDFRNFEIDHDTKLADEKMGPILNAVDPDLSRFRKRGGKLLMFHGWSDAAIPPVSTVLYYESVVHNMGAQEVSSFMRLYMVPGMQHCGGGPGPNVFGQFGVPQRDAEHDLDRALERWVEEDVAPGEIIATKYKAGMNPASGVERTRPLCAYPQVARWKGSGSTDAAANFTCVDQPPVATR